MYRVMVLKAWSNGRFYNVKHRIQCWEAPICVSIALFMLGLKQAAVEAPPELVDDDHPRLYVPITFEEYRKLRLSTHMRAGGALALLSSGSFCKSWRDRGGEIAV